MIAQNHLFNIIFRYFFLTCSKMAFMWPRRLKSLFLTYYPQSYQKLLQMNQELVVSKAPGKVLIAGGYGVLQENNFGLTLALNNHFYCVCLEFFKELKTNVHVHSPQIGKNWEYIANGQSIIEKSGKQNLFVENAILWTLRFHQNLELAGKIKLLILFDRDFISSQSISDQKKPKFPSYNENYAKTGLGSSACVLVSIVECLVKLFQPNITEKVMRKEVNVISHVANLAAQKKIGSNFDISTAVFGSHLYKNVLPRKVYPIISEYSFEKYKSLIEINPEITYLFEFMDGLHGYIVDINKGQNTRKMVSGFLANLKKTQNHLQEEFFQTSKKIVTSLYDAFRQKNTSQMKAINQVYRSFQQKYSKITQIPVQPEDLTPILDLVLEIEEVCYAVCPGSGGYDAIFILSTGDVLTELKKKVGELHSVRSVKLIKKREQMEVTNEDKKNIEEYIKQSQI